MRVFYNKWQDPKIAPGVVPLLTLKASGFMNQLPLEYLHKGAAEVQLVLC